MGRVRGILFAGVMWTLIAAPGFTGGQAEETGAGTADGTAEGDAGIEVFVSIQPQKYFVERVAGSDAQVSVMVPPGKEPHSYEPTPRQVSRLSEADVYFRIGVPFEEAFIPRIARSLEDLEIVDTTEDITLRRLDAHDHGADDDHEDEEAEGALDPHVWLGPLQVKKIAASIRDTLSSLRPENEAAYRENYEEFAADIDALHEELSAELAPYEGETMFVFHPSFGYFADTYGLDQEAVEIGGNEPSAAQLERIVEEARSEGVQVIFVQPQFSRDSAERVAEAIDGAVIAIDPLAEDWMSNMRTIAERVREGLD
ncbi:MAG: zinc ABC transporter substrate-binding protein [Spirochaetia bacterium]